MDEVEKAHPEVMNVLLQILEDGFLTDAKGRRVSFKNTIVILTSNLGTDMLNKQAVMGFSKGGTAVGDYDKTKTQVLGELKKTFRPELLNRFDKIIVFKPLGPKEIEQIVELQLQDLIKRVGKQKIKLNVTDAAKAFLAKRGFEPELGARPVRRLIQTSIEDPLVEGILNKDFGKGGIVKIGQTGDKIDLIVSKKGTVKSTTSSKPKPKTKTGSTKAKV